ncbi:YceI family protein [Ammonicoccus fulvus]|uniref:YceI family protein n=1 Tax=Ammonicoccus fulvus TaxID=3138240 RepID=A0ABZ3FM11_9ACTN
MNLPTGTQEFGAEDTDLLVHTTCDGAAARLGHNLTLVFTSWRAVLARGDEPAASSLEVTVDLDSLDIRDSSGGVKPMTDNDRAEIKRNAAKSLRTREHPQLRFVTTEITGSWSAGEITGDVTLNGTTSAATFQVVALNGGFRLGGELKQSAFGIKPYSAMMGTLRLSDSVLLEVHLPQA